MAPVESYKDLKVWQAAMDMACSIYEITKKFPTSEQYGLTMQLRRAAVSVPSNIAEGHRRTRPGFVHHVQIALGSLAELETQLSLAERLKMCRAEDAVGVQTDIAGVGKMLHALLRALRD